MIWKTKTHLISSTVCNRTGQPCPALAELADNLTRAMNAVKPTTTQDFEIEGDVVLNGCSVECSARFRASHEQLRVFCGVSPEAEIDMLDKFADALFSSEGPALVARRNETHPCAMVEATPITDSSARQPAFFSQRL